MTQVQVEQVFTDSTVGSTRIEQRVEHRVVVVVDGSASSITALRLAVERAQQIGAEVDLLCAPEVQAAAETLRRMRRYRDTYGQGQVMPRSAAGSRLESTAREYIEHCVERAFPNGWPGVPVRVWISQNECEDHRAADTDVSSAAETPHPTSPRQAMPWRLTRRLP